MKIASRLHKQVLSLTVEVAQIMLDIRNGTLGGYNEGLCFSRVKLETVTIHALFDLREAVNKRMEFINSCCREEAMELYVISIEMIGFIPVALNYPTNKSGHRTEP